MWYHAAVNLRLAAALAAGRLAQASVRRLRLGGGTALPGLVASIIEPASLARLAASLPHGSVIVTGTNGKTTTSRLIADALRLGGLVPIHNRTGSNMMRGMTAAAVAAASLRGTLPADIGVWEVDEATVPEALAAIKPRVIIINNLFRDQLDRYGEVNTVAAIWQQALGHLPEASTLVLNADDPRVAHLGAGVRCRVVYFGMNDARIALDGLPSAVDSIHCLNCAYPLVYEAVFSSHLGRYSCAHCGLRRPALDVSAAAVTLADDGSTSTVESAQGRLRLELGLPGLYNAYNALAASAVCLALGLAIPVIEESVRQFRAAFGRVERMSLGNKYLYLFLVKNPTGFNEVLRTVVSSDRRRHVLILINDLLADGTDVSWLWDVDFEAMAGKTAHVTVSGIRAHDLALRLRYAGVAIAPGAAAVAPDVAQGLTEALAATPAGETLYVLPTYTAMLGVKDELARRGLAARWQDD